MTQSIDIRYRAKATSDVINQRFLDVTGPCTLRGFRLKKGTKRLSVSLMRGKYVSSSAITPSGAKVTETDDLLDILFITSNKDNPRHRIDSIYMEYIFAEKSEARYRVVTGTHVPAANPNPATHLLLGYVTIRAKADYILDEDVESAPYGFSKLNVAGHAEFNGTATFNKPVVFNDLVSFQGGTLDGRLNISGFDYDKEVGAYTRVQFTQPDGRMYMETELLDPELTIEGIKFYHYLQAKYYEPTGKRIKSTTKWKLLYDEYGNIRDKIVVNEEEGDIV